MFTGTFKQCPMFRNSIISYYMRLQSSNIDVYISTTDAYKNPPTSLIPLTAEVGKKGNNQHATIIVHSER